MKTPNNSIGQYDTHQFWHSWHPENMTPIVLLAVRFVIKNVITANANVMVKLPVTFIPKGINPKYLRITQRKR
jgi:hypothetical protein